MKKNNFILTTQATLNILLMFSWYQYSFSTCYILAITLVKSSLFVIIEYALLNKEKPPHNIFYYHK